MAYVIDENCVACGTCKAGCPVDAISEGDIFVIDPDVCISCGTCAENCPAGATPEAKSVNTQRNSARPTWRAKPRKGGGLPYSELFTRSLCLLPGNDYICN